MEFFVKLNYGTTQCNAHLWELKIPSHQISVIFPLSFRTNILPFLIFYDLSCFITLVENCGATSSVSTVFTVVGPQILCVFYEYMIHHPGWSVQHDIYDEG